MVEKVWQYLFLLKWGVVPEKDNFIRLSVSLWVCEYSQVNLVLVFFPYIPITGFPGLRLTWATLAVTAAIIKTEKIHNVLWWQWEVVKSIHSPERRVAGHSLPAVLLDAVQVEHGVPRVSRVLH